MEKPPEDKETSTVLDNKKRGRCGDSDPDSPGAKLARVDSAESNSTPSYVDDPSAEPCFDSDDSAVDPSEAKRIQDELLSVLDDSDEPSIQGLDSVIKSFEDEILPAPVEMTSFPGETQPDLGYLLEASDDELGLPPTFSTENSYGVGEDSGGKKVENELPVGYDSFELGLTDDGSYNGEGFVAMGGVFDYPDESFGSGDILGFHWPIESLPAL